MDKDKQRLLQKIYEAIHMCEEQDLHHEKSLLSMAAGCIEDEETINDHVEFQIECNSINDLWNDDDEDEDINNELIQMEDQDWYDTEEERLKKEKL